ncbi:hypothetical protein AA309_02465, partial [Microvirga vignae]
FQTPSRADSPYVESALFVALPHFLTANRIHFAGKCFRRLDDAAAGKARQSKKGWRRLRQPSWLVP